MKNQTNLLTTSLLIVAGVFAILAFKPSEKAATVYEYKQFSTVESLVAGGLGRSRILTTDEKGVSVEKDLMNFFSMVGINFGNISNNDKLIVDRINEYSNEGWELAEVTTGVQSSSKDASGIFITRYLFRRTKK
ncbi:MAG: hypothetical protein WCK82_06795 [Bacteroidota bacterium]|jgi:hypothetical protein